LIRVPGKTESGEQRGGTHSAPEREAQCRACRWWARLEIGSLGTKRVKEKRRRRRTKDIES